MYDTDTDFLVATVLSGQINTKAVDIVKTQFRGCISSSSHTFQDRHDVSQLSDPL